MTDSLTTHSNPTPMSRRSALILTGAAIATLTSCTGPVLGVRYEHVATPEPLTTGPTERLRETLRRHCAALANTTKNTSGNSTPALTELAEHLASHVTALGPQHTPTPSPTTPLDPPIATAAEATTEDGLPDVLDASAELVKPLLDSADAGLATLAAQIVATHTAWAAHLRKKTTPQPGSPPAPAASPAPSADGAAESPGNDADVSPLQEAVNAALAARYALAYHLGVMAPNAKGTVGKRLRARLQRSDATIAMLRQFAEDRGLAIARSRAAYPPLPSTDPVTAVPALERAVGSADSRLFRSCAPADRAWALSLLTADAAHGAWPYPLNLVA